MMYFEEMETKWGFNDGNSVPDGATVYRKVYVLALNKLLEKHNSNVRVVAYNRDGVHNFCLICRVTAEEFKKISEEDVTSGDSTLGTGWTEPDKDEGYEKAFEEAMEAGLDDMILTTVRVNEKAFKEFLKG